MVPAVTYLSQPQSWPLWLIIVFAKLSTKFLKFLRFIVIFSLDGPLDFLNEADSVGRVKDSVEVTIEQTETEEQQTIEQQVFSITTGQYKFADHHKLILNILFSY